MKRLLVFLGLSMSFTTSCMYASSHYTYDGAMVGGLGGAIAGSMLDKSNSWRGAVIGGTLGAVVGGSITEIAGRSARESAMHNRPVEYRSEDGRGRIYSEPVLSAGSCKLIRTTYYQNGRIIRIEEKEVCYR